MTIIARELLAENIVAADRVVAERSAEAAIIARAQAEAPHSYAELAAANARHELGGLLAELAAEALRMQALRFVIEREEALGVRWGWGDVDAVQVRFARLAEAWRAEQRALAQLELATSVHDEAVESAESGEELAAAVETHGLKADIFFERRAAREALEREVFPAPRLPKAEVRARLTDLKRADIAERGRLSPRSQRRAVRGW